MLNEVKSNKKSGKRFFLLVFEIRYCFWVL